MRALSKVEMGAWLERMTDGVLNDQSLCPRSLASFLQEMSAHCRSRSRCNDEGMGLWLLNIWHYARRFANAAYFAASFTFIVDSPPSLLAQKTSSAPV
jgi:hypothetical protein